MISKKIKVLSAVMAAVMAFGGTSVLTDMGLRASAYDLWVANYCDLEDNKPMPYEAGYWSQPKLWTETVDSMAYKNVYGKEVRLWFDKAVVRGSAGGKIQRVYFRVSGAEGRANRIWLHILYDKRLELQDHLRGIKKTDDGALRDMSSVYTFVDDGLVRYSAGSENNNMHDGAMFYMDFKLPANAKPGCVYPIGIRYQNDGGTDYDKFIDSGDTAEGRAMMAYVFNHGVENGYIAVKAAIGDVNGDGSVNVADIAKTAAHIKSRKMLDKEQSDCADADRSGKINITDLAKIAAHVKGKKLI